MMQPTRALAITTLFYMLCAPWLARAQSVAGEDLTSLSIEDLVRVKVFSASRHLEEARGAPAAVSVVTVEAIATFGRLGRRCRRMISRRGTSAIWRRNVPAAA